MFCFDRDTKCGVERSARSELDSRDELILALGRDRGQKTPVRSIQFRSAIDRVSRSLLRSTCRDQTLNFAR